MITGLILAGLGGIVSLFASLLPSLPSPAAVFGGFSDTWATITSNLAGAAYWFPFALMGGCLVVIAAVLVAAGGIKLVRIVASFVTLGGGSAA